MHIVCGTQKTRFVAEGDVGLGDCTGNEGKPHEKSCF